MKRHWFSMNGNVFRTFFRQTNKIVFSRYEQVDFWITHWQGHHINSIINHGAFHVEPKDHHPPLPTPKFQHYKTSPCLIPHHCTLDFAECNLWRIPIKHFSFYESSWKIYYQEFIEFVEQLDLVGELIQCTKKPFEFAVLWNILALTWNRIPLM